MPTPLNQKSLTELLVIYDAWLGPQRGLLEGAPLLVPWIPELEALQARLRSFTPEPGAPPLPPLGPLDARAEAAVRSLRYLLLAMQERHTALGDAEAAARWARLEERLFSEGLGFLNRALPLQIATTRRLLELAQEADTQALLAATALHDTTGAGLLDTIQALTDALDEALAARDGAPPLPSGYQQLRTEAIRLVHDVRTIIDRKLTGDARTKLLGAG